MLYYAGLFCPFWPLYPFCPGWFAKVKLSENSASDTILPHKMPLFGCFHTKSNLNGIQISSDKGSPCGFLVWFRQHNRSFHENYLPKINRIFNSQEPCHWVSSEKIWNWIPGTCSLPPALHILYLFVNIPRISNSQIMISHLTFACLNSNWKDLSTIDVTSKVLMMHLSKLWRILEILKAINSFLTSNKML